jgi:hypothetical protein
MSDARLFGDVDDVTVGGPDHQKQERAPPAPQSFLPYDVRALPAVTVFNISAEKREQNAVI